MAKTSGQVGSIGKAAGMLMKGAVLGTLVSAVAPAWPQQPSAAAAADESAQVAGQAVRQPLDLDEAISGDVLEPLQSAIQTQNVMQALSVFDSQSFPAFPQFRDQLRAFLDSYSAVLFRYKILQASTSEDGRASATCEADLDAKPYDEGRVPVRRSTQLQLQLKQTPKGWRISRLTPDDFFAQ